MNIFGFLSAPLGFILKLMYSVVQNYGWALILFTLATRLILLPLSLKQQKSMVQMNILKPKMDALQKQYGDNKEALSQETMKLYKKYGVSPFSGCLPLLIQFPVLFALFDVIKKPLTFIWGLSAETKDAIINAVKAIPELAAKIPAGYEQLLITAELAKDATAAPSIAAKMAEAGAQNIPNLADFAIKYNFFGLDLSTQPSIDFNAPNFGASWIWIIPIVAALTTYLSSKFMNIGMEKKKEETNKPKRPPRPGEKAANDNPAGGMMKIMPLMTLWFTFMMPAGISIYWIAGNVIQIAQQFVVNKYYVPKLKERMEQEYNEREDNNKKRKNKR